LPTNVNLSAKLAEKVLRAVIPPLQDANTVEPDPLPLPSVSNLVRDESMAYTLARLDSSGRVADRTLATLLGWHPGDRLDVQAASGVVVFRRTTHGAYIRRGQSYLTVPASCRALCDIRTGDPLLLVAAPEHDVLLLHNAASLDAMILLYHEVAANAREAREQR
jgi:hypothetical protein